MQLPKKLKKGFTLIEILVVIAIIAVLAVAVLSAINPVEQIKKGTDTALKSDAAEFLNASERYYTTFQKYPWGTTTPNGSAIKAADGTLMAGVQELIDKSELKSQFTGRKSLSSLYVTETTTNNLVSVCFKPESNTTRSLATKGKTGVAAAGCPPSPLSSWTSTTECYVCAPE